MEKRGFFKTNTDRWIFTAFILVFLFSFTYKLGSYYYELVPYFFLASLFLAPFMIFGVLTFPLAFVYQTLLTDKFSFLPGNLNTIYLLLMFIIVVLALNLKKERLLKDKNSLLILGLAVILFSTTLYHKLPIRPYNYEFMHFIEAIAIFFVITIFIKSDKRLRMFIWILVLGIASLAFRLYNHSYTYDFAIQGFENNYLSRVFSFYLPFVIGVMWAEKEKIFKFLSFFILIFVAQGITQMGSRATYLSAGISLILMGAMNLRRKSTWGLAFLGIILVLFFVPSSFYSDIGSIFNVASGGEVDASIQGRQWAAEKGWELFAERPMIGYGVYNARYENLLADHFGIFKSGHNSYVIMAVEMGVFGLLFYIALFISSIFNCFKAQKISKHHDKYIYAISNGTMFGILAIGINQYMLNNPWIPTVFIGFGLSSVLLYIAKQKQKQRLKKKPLQVTIIDIPKKSTLKKKHKKKSFNKR